MVMLGTTVLIASMLVPLMGGSNVSFCPLLYIYIYIYIYIYFMEVKFEGSYHF
jgi:hypothetical protein